MCVRTDGRTHDAACERAHANVVTPPTTDEEETPLQSLSAIAGDLSNAMRWYVTFGGPDVVKLKKTGELAGLKMDGDLPRSVREFDMAKIDASSQNHESRPSTNRSSALPGT